MRGGNIDRTGVTGHREKIFPVLHAEFGAQHGDQTLRGLHGELHAFFYTKKRLAR